MLFRPKGGEKQETGIKKVFNLMPVENAADPMILKLSFWDDKKYLYDFNRLKRLDEQCFSKLAASIGIAHSGIR